MFNSNYKNNNILALEKINDAMNNSVEAFSQLSKGFQETQDNLMDFRKVIIDNNNKYDDLESKYNELKRLLDRSKQSNEALIQEINELNRKEDSGDKINHLNNKVAELEQTIIQLKNNNKQSSVSSDEINNKNILIEKLNNELSRKNKFEAGLLSLMNEYHMVPESNKSPSTILPSEPIIEVAAEKILEIETIKVEPRIKEPVIKKAASPIKKQEVLLTKIKSSKFSPPVNFNESDKSGSSSDEKEIIPQDQKLCSFTSNIKDSPDLNELTILMDLNKDTYDRIVYKRIVKNGFTSNIRGNYPGLNIKNRDDVYKFSKLHNNSIKKYKENTSKITATVNP